MVTEYAPILPLEDYLLGEEIWVIRPTSELKPEMVILRPGHMMRAIDLAEASGSMSIAASRFPTS
jgi:hypothetical protein